MLLRALQRRLKLGAVSLEEARNRVRMNLLQNLLEVSTSASRSCPCGWSGKHCLAYIEALRWNSGLWPQDILKQTTWQAIGAAERFKLPNLEYKDVSCPNSNRHWEPDFRNKLEEHIFQLRKEGGICLLCIQSGERHEIHAETKGA